MNLQQKHYQAIEALLAGQSREEVAESCAISVRTLERWLADAAFANAYRQAVEVKFYAALEHAQIQAVEAVKALVRQLQATRPSEQIAAADRLLHHVVKLRDSVDLARRVEELEKRLGTREQAGSPGATPGQGGVASNGSPADVPPVPG